MNANIWPPVVEATVVASVRLSASITQHQLIFLDPDLI